METINNVELRDEDVYPDDSVLESVLEDSYPSYLKLLALFKEIGLIPEWRYYKDGNAWLCKVQKAKKTIVWMSAWKGFMQATVYFPLRLLESVLALDISEQMKEKIRNTKNVGKSQPCIFEIHSDEILDELETVMHHKIISK